MYKTITSRCKNKGLFIKKRNNSYVNINEQEPFYVQEQQR